MARTALITGAAKRVGAAIARALAEDGYRLHVHAWSSSAEAKSLADELRTAYGCSVAVHVCDFGDLEAVSQLADRLRCGPHPPQLVINNASLFEHQTDEGEGSIDDWLRYLTINLLAPIGLIKALDPRAADAHVVNVLDARMDLRDAVRMPYELSKAALGDYTLLAAKQLAPRVRVNALAPGLLLPPSGRDCTYLEERASRAPMGRPGQTADLAQALRFLETAGYVTGQVVFVDGGEHLG